MDISEIVTHVDHTDLKPCTTWEEVERLCEEAVQYHMASVCIPPSFVKRVKEAYGSRLAVCTVIGFPLGYNTPETKLFETREALENGADEVDMVINLGDVKNGNYEAVTAEIRSLKEACGDKILKVIVEACYLTSDEKVALCRCVTEAGADYIKTSTGFGPSGAAVEDVELFKRYIGEDVKIKAAGGMRTLDDYEKFLGAGAERLGTSAAVQVYNSTAR